MILGGAGDSAALAEREELIRESIASTTSDYEREKLQERLAKLTGGIAIIKVPPNVYFVVFCALFVCCLWTISVLTSWFSLSFGFFFTPIFIPVLFAL